MTYLNPTNDWWPKAEIQDKRVGFIIALSIHFFLFFMSGKIFVTSAQYSVQTSNGSIDVNLIAAPQPKAEAIKSPEPIQEKEEESLQIPKAVTEVPVKEKNEAKSPNPNSGVTVKANPNYSHNYFHNLPPPYPELAKQMRQEGLVVLSVDVDREGKPSNVTIEQSSNYQMLDEAALKAVSHWRFQPGRIGDLPIESKVIVPIRFRLEE